MSTADALAAARRSRHRRGFGRLRGASARAASGVPRESVESGGGLRKWYPRAFAAACFPGACAGRSPAFRTHGRRPPDGGV